MKCWTVGQQAHAVEPGPPGVACMVKIGTLVRQYEDIFIVADVGSCAELCYHMVVQI